MTDKILKLLLKLKGNLDKDWKDSLQKINVYDDVGDLYATHDTYHANCLLTYIVFAYHMQSEWLELHKDRMENKIKIMSSIVGDWAMTDEVFNNALYGKDKATENVINWLFEYQKDWRWKEAERSFSYHSHILEFAKTIEANEETKDALGKGKCMEEAYKRRIHGDALVKTLREEYMVLDTIASQEERPKPTNQIAGVQPWESFIKGKKK